MSVDFYQRQIAQHQKTIANLMVDKGKAAAKVATASKRASDAAIAARRATSTSTFSSKMNESARYTNEANRSQEEIGKIELKIANEHKKIVEDQRRLTQEIDRENKKQIADQKRQLASQQRANRDHERMMTSLSAGHTRHEQLHADTARRIEMLNTLPERIVVAFFASDPGNSASTRLALDEEARDIGKQIRASAHRDAVDFQSRWAVRPMDILQAINELNPTVAHFSGHGSENDELVLQDDLGQPKFIRKEAIVHTISVATDSVKLVFFNTCFSFGQAQESIKHVNAAIGMKKTIGDKAARIFSSQFYSAIGFGLPIEKAFKQAQAALMMEVPEEADTPALYIKEGVSEEELTLVKPNIFSA